MRLHRIALLSAALTASAITGLAVHRAPRAAKSATHSERTSANVDTPPVASAMPHPARWMAFGGGAEPASNQVSIENDLALAVRILGPEGILLFAGGPGSDGVFELARPLPADATKLALAEVFASHGGHEGRFRKTRLLPHGPATRDAILTALHRELAVDGAPLVVYVDGHGDGGEQPLDNRIVTWGGDSIRVREFIEGLDRAQRPLRLVVSTCFSGGFAEMVFRSGRADLGATDADRCGLFASTWDLEATGCDPDPDRRSHDGYAVHLLDALQGHDARGRNVRVDADGDGRISLLEAHSYARIVSRGMDVPTTTSERWLRAVAPPDGPMAPVSLPEEDMVIEALSSESGLHMETGDPLALARARLDRLEREYERLADADRRSAEALDASRNAVRGELLARWPVLDDPWHPTFDATLERERSSIEASLASSKAFSAFRHAQEAAVRTSDDALDVALARAPVERLVRALENRVLAGRLRHRGGTEWARYEKFLACERTSLR